MRRLGWLLPLVASALLWPASASAYPTPSGLVPSNWSSVCPPRPSDVGNASGWDIDQQVSVARSATGSVSGSTGGGVDGLTVVATASGSAKVTLTDANGATQTVYSGSMQAGTNLYVEITLPPGPVTVSITNNGTGTFSFTVLLVNGGENSLLTTATQELADGCYAGQGTAAQAHTDAGSIDSDVQAVKSAVNGLTSGGVTLATLHSDLQQLDTDVKASGSGGGGTSTTGTTTGPELVELSSADRALQANSETEVHGALWVIVGVILACFVGGEVLRRLFP